MNRLSIPIPKYRRETDTIFNLATRLHPSEINTKSSTELYYPSDLPYPDKNKDLRNYIRFEPIFKVPIPYKSWSMNASDEKDENNSSSLPQQVQDAEKAKKRQMKGNNSSWLGNAVISKQKKRKLK